MDPNEARGVLEAELATLEGLDYATLRSRVEGGPSFAGMTFVTRGETETKTVKAPSGTEYHLEVNVFWDHKPGGALRVMVAVDDGDEAAKRPLVGDFVRQSPG